MAALCSCSDTFRDIEGETSDSRLGSLKAHQIGTFAVLITVFLITYFLLGPALYEVTPGKAWMLGLIWLGMTICFEFLFGHYVVGHSWKHLLADYKVFQGRIWGLFLSGITISPRLIQILRELVH